jgi:Na+/H+-dicarboxylate symporter
VSTPKHPGPPAWLITGGSLVGLGAGLAAGVAANRGAAPALLALLPTMEVIGTLWTNALLMVILPLVVSLLIGAVASLGRHPRSCQGSLVLPLPRH